MKLPPQVRFPFLALLAFAVVLLAGPLRAMDRVRVETRTDDAIAKYGVQGRGVLVAILDRGIDWRNADFRNPDGTTRLEAIFDLTDNSGANAADNPFQIGTIYTRAQIDAALLGGPALATRDAVGHGTTTAGIAVGGGSNDARFRGIAPQARIIAVKLTTDTLPAHDGEAAETGFFDPNLIPVAMDFATSRAAALGLPCVMLLNIGSVGGPTDGTSKLARKIDATVGPGKPGLAFVTGASDDSGAANRAGGNVALGQTVALEIEKVDGTVDFDLWYPEADRFRVRITTPDGPFGPYEAPAGPAAQDVQTAASFLYYHNGRDTDFNEAANDKRQLWIRFSGPAGKYIVELEGVTITTGRFDATLNPSRFEAFGSPIHRFLTFTAPGSIWDLATASNNICPNSYIIRTNYTDLDGIPRTLSEGALGGLWRGSGVGPTFDGRLGMDVSAPGDSLFTTYNPKSWWATFRFNVLENSGGLYGRASAVSAANPIVTGIIALLLEMDPTLDAARIKRILQQSARADAFTGAVPNPDWGHGKVDALAALDLLHAELTRLTTQRPNNPSARFTARGQAGRSYVFEASANLRTWQPMQTNVAATLPFNLTVPTDRAAHFRRPRRSRNL